MMRRFMDDLRKTLLAGVAIPAHPLALDANRRLDERRQRALSRYYLAAGAGGLAVAVHTTQFAIRDPRIGLFRPVLELAGEEVDRAGGQALKIGGICGSTAQATSEAAILRELGYHAGLLSLAAMKDASEDELIDHCRAIASGFPIIGFYLQPAVGGRALPFSFWRRFAEIPQVVAIKIAPFNRYQTLDVVRAVIEAGPDDIALYTGNDDNIVLDLITPFRMSAGDKVVEKRIVGGLLGHWSVWTRRAVELLKKCQAGFNGPDALVRAVEVTDANAAFFDAANAFRGCIAGLHEVLRRQGLLQGIWCLDPAESLSPGQAQEIDRVYRAYPHLNDDAFVSEHRDEWLRG
jgi:dihydrodipicolinate synthase/N-acetylneuraminate lyase